MIYKWINNPNQRREHIANPTSSPQQKEGIPSRKKNIQHNDTSRHTRTTAGRQMNEKTKPSNNKNRQHPHHSMGETSHSTTQQCRPTQKNNLQRNEWRNKSLHQCMLGVHEQKIWRHVFWFPLLTPIVCLARFCKLTARVTFTAPVSG